MTGGWIVPESNLLFVWANYVGNHRKYFFVENTGGMKHSSDVKNMFTTFALGYIVNVRCDSVQSAVVLLVGRKAIGLYRIVLVSRTRRDGHA